MSRSRRKTLSHTEIENFLFDITPQPQPQPLSSSSSSSISPSITSNSKCIPSPSLSSSPGKENHGNFDVVKGNQKIVDENLPLKKDDQKNLNKMTVYNLKQTIRLIYSQLPAIHHHRPTSTSSSPLLSDEIKSHINAIFEDTNYRLLPARILTPSSFPFPSSTLAAKKALLIEMTPMLTEGENQRKLETTKCEEFTRCRVEKNKIRSSCYEYVDIDTGLKITGEEYTQRYMMFVQHSKHITPHNVNYRGPNPSPTTLPPDPSDLSAMTLLTQSINGHQDDQRTTTITTKKTPLKEITTDASRQSINSLPLPFSIPPSLSSSSQPQDPIWGHDQDLQDPLLGCCCENEIDENFISIKQQKKKRERQNISYVSSRRRTLSPTTSRNMLLEAALEGEDGEGTQEEVDEVPPLFSSSSEGEKSSVNEMIIPLSVDLLKSSVIPPSPDLMEVTLVPDTSSLPSPPSSTEQSFPSLSSPPDHHPSAISSPSSPLAFVSAFPPTQKIKGVALISQPSQQKTREALQRYKLRQEIARWKYCWETVSSEAAMVALQFSSAGIN